jgi:hypothetical protein
MTTGWPVEVPYAAAFTCPVYAAAACVGDIDNPEIAIPIPIAEDVDEMSFMYLIKALLANGTNAVCVSVLFTMFPFLV